VSKVLTRHASAILLDPEFGQAAMRVRAPGSGLLTSYENSGYDNDRPGRLPELLPGYDVAKLVELGADAIKILLYYTPFEDAVVDGRSVNDIKHEWVRGIGEECAKNDAPFFLECVAYDPHGGSGQDLEFARTKPEAVIAYTTEFSKPEYQVDVLKNEVPINMAYVEGSKANTTGETAYSRSEAKDLFNRAAEASTLPIIYLSAGVDDDVFRETIELAGESGANFAGVLCGRATWKEGIPVYAKQGAAALEDWLSDRGVKNIQALNAVLQQTARSWTDKYGGRDQIQVA
jgi:tagatose 1,6-diphosphate aldolase